MAVQRPTREYEIVLGCQDRALRVLRGSEVQYEAAVEGPATVVKSFNSLASPADGEPASAARPDSTHAARIKEELGELNAKLESAHDHDEAAAIEAAIADKKRALVSAEESM